MRLPPDDVLRQMIRDEYPPLTAEKFIRLLPDIPPRVMARLKADREQLEQERREQEEARKKDRYFEKNEVWIEGEDEDEDDDDDDP